MRMLALPFATVVALSMLPAQPAAAQSADPLLRSFMLWLDDVGGSRIGYRDDDDDDGHRRVRSRDDDDDDGSRRVRPRGRDDDDDDDDDDGRGRDDDDD